MTKLQQASYLIVVGKLSKTCVAESISQFVFGFVYREVFGVSGFLDPRISVATIFKR
jgi:hypothetical protein